MERRQKDRRLKTDVFPNEDCSKITTLIFVYLPVFENIHSSFLNFVVFAFLVNHSLHLIAFGIDNYHFCTLSALLWNEIIDIVCSAHYSKTRDTLIKITKKQINLWNSWCRFRDQGSCRLYRIWLLVRLGLFYCFSNWNCRLGVLGMQLLNFHNFTFIIAFNINEWLWN